MANLRDVAHYHRSNSFVCCILLQSPASLLLKLQKLAKTHLILIYEVIKAECPMSINIYIGIAETKLQLIPAINKSIKLHFRMNEKINVNIKICLY